MKDVSARRLLIAVAAAVIAVAMTTAVGAQPMPPPAGAAPFGQMASGGPVLAGVEAYQEADYTDAIAAFREAVRRKPHDSLAKVWLGLAQVASGDDRHGIFTLKFATGTLGAWAPQAAELIALAYWREGNVTDAKSELDYCVSVMSAALCTDMKRGVESGQQPPDVNVWPRIVGILRATQARSSAWTP